MCNILLSGIASEPNTLTVAVNKANYTHDMIKDTGACNISVISTGASFDLFKHFGFQSGRDVDKFADFPEVSYKLAENGIPVITVGTNAWFSLKVKPDGRSELPHSVHMRTCGNERS